jgi:hypothetical protein
MSFSSLRAEKTELRALDNLQRALQEMVRTLSNIPILAGTLHEDVDVPASPGSVTVSHGLGRPWRGYIVAKRAGSATAQLFHLTLSNGDPEVVQFSCFGGGSGRFSIWVF